MLYCQKRESLTYISATDNTGICYFSRNIIFESQTL